MRISTGSRVDTISSIGVSPCNCPFKKTYDGPLAKMHNTSTTEKLHHGAHPTTTMHISTTVQKQQTTSPHTETQTRKHKQKRKQRNLNRNKEKHTETETNNRSRNINGNRNKETDRNKYRNKGTETLREAQSINKETET